MKQIVLFLTLLATTLAQPQISPQFFSMHSGGGNPWPSAAGIQFSSWRTLMSMVKWCDINTAHGVYDWDRLDRVLGFAEQGGQSVLYTVYFTPAWASQCPTCSCGKQLTGGGCYPPVDLNPDGTGTDQDLKDFITALLQHVGPGKITYLEVWNEPNVSGEYSGTIAQLVRMASDVRSVAKSIDPKILIVSPAETGEGGSKQDWVQMPYLGQFLAAGGGTSVDVIGLHGYVVNPEDMITRVNNTIAIMQANGQTGKPIFVTEGSWATSNGFMPTNMQPGFSFRHYLAMLSTPVQRFYLYAFNNEADGNLWDSTEGALTAGGVIYQRYYGWLVGAKMTQPCQPQTPGSAIWSCDLNVPVKGNFRVIWNSLTAWGQTTSVQIPNGYFEYMDLYGNTYPIRNHSVPVGYDPIVLVRR